MGDEHFESFYLAGGFGYPKEHNGTQLGDDLDVEIMQRTTGTLLLDLANTVQDWSQESFGTKEERGPIGPLKHLAKEAQEAQDRPADRAEYADCLILVLDASWRAGIEINDLLAEALAKMEINKTRSYPKGIKDGEPIEHDRSKD